MTQEEKQLLLKDLCARLPYGVIGLYTWKCRNSYNRELTGSLYDELKSSWNSSEDSQFLPYLRPMSSMTEEEEIELSELFWNSKADYQGATAISDFCYAHHLDNHDLIPAGLASEAPEEIYD